MKNIHIISQSLGANNVGDNSNVVHTLHILITKQTNKYTRLRNELDILNVFVVR